MDSSRITILQLYLIIVRRKTYLIFMRLIEWFTECNFEIGTDFNEIDRILMMIGRKMRSIVAERNTFQYLFESRFALENRKSLV